jgi:hypothetical protein
MLEPQVLDDFERKVGIAEMEVATMEVACRADDTKRVAIEGLARTIANCIDAVGADTQSPAISPLFGLKVRATEVAVRMRRVLAGRLSMG